MENVVAFNEAEKYENLERIRSNDDLKRRKDEFKNVRPIRYSNDFKKAVVMEVNNGLSKDGAMRKYGIGGHTTVLRWIRQYENSSKIILAQEKQPAQPEKSIKEIKSENLRLQKELELSQLKVRALNVMIDTAEIKTEVPIRKLLHQDSFLYLKESNKKNSVFPLRHLASLSKRFTNRVLVFIGKKTK